MPELPEVETTCRALGVLMNGQRIIRVRVREPRLRWPVAESLSQSLVGRSISHVSRRAKYILVHVPPGTLIIHLGMSGSLLQVDASKSPRKHDHVDIELDDGTLFRYHDPRRFGSMHWTESLQDHFLLKDLGPEPLDDEFGGRYLHDRSRGRRVAVKNFIMSGQVVVGVGNIYASEALYHAGIHPKRAAGRVSRPRYERLSKAIRSTLEAAIESGGTTLRDFASGSGEPGYFGQKLFVYGREGEPCRQCGSPVHSAVIGQRSSYYCTLCQR